jgi:hypothetical protein
MRRSSAIDIETAAFQPRFLRPKGVTSEEDRVGPHREPDRSAREADRPRRITSSAATRATAPTRSNRFAATVAAALRDRFRSIDRVITPACRVATTVLSVADLCDCYKRWGNARSRATAVRRTARAVREIPGIPPTA